MSSPGEAPVLLDGRTVVEALRRSWWIMVLVAVLGAAAGFIVYLTTPSEFRAEQQVLVTGQITNPLLLDLKSGALDPSQLVASQAAIITSGTVGDRVARRLGTSPPVVQAEAVDQSSVMLIYLDGPSPTRAGEVLDTYVSEYLGLLREQDVARLGTAQTQLENQIAEFDRQIALLPRATDASPLLTQRVEVQSILDQLRAASAFGSVLTERVGDVHVDPDRTRPVLSLYVAVGGVFGFFLGALIALVRNRRVALPRPKKDVVGARAPQNTSKNGSHHGSRTTSKHKTVPRSRPADATRAGSDDGTGDRPLEEATTRTIEAVGDTRPPHRRN